MTSTPENSTNNETLKKLKEAINSKITALKESPLNKKRNIDALTTTENEKKAYGLYRKHLTKGKNPETLNQGILDLVTSYHAKISEKRRQLSKVFNPSTTTINNESSAELSQFPKKKKVRTFH